MDNQASINAGTSIGAPIAIGGIGGSGTRVVAQIVQALGVYIGSTLNSSLDNLWFTVLFKRPSWFSKFPSKVELANAIDLFQRAMVDGLASSITAVEKAYIFDLVKEFEESPRPIGAKREDAEQLISSFRSDADNRLRWGWKEPNTHVFLRQICQQIEKLRYIHVIRHGLDMAFSANQQQIVNWGPFFGIERERIDCLDASVKLDYWITANEAAMQTARELLGDRFLLLSYDALWSKPYDSVKQLLEFLGMDVSSDQLSRLITIPKKPVTADRFRSHNISQFSSLQLAAVRRLARACEI